MTKLIMRAMGAALIIGGIVGALAIGPAVAADDQPEAAASNEKKFTVVSEQIGDTKFWLPSTIVVEPGDKVTLTLKNEVPGTAVTHGFALPAYNISEVVTRGTPDVVHFTADKTGIYPYFCQLHPAHIGGQLIVEPAAK